MARAFTALLALAAAPALAAFVVQGNAAFSEPEVEAAAFADGTLSTAAVERLYLRAGYLDVAVAVTEAEGDTVLTVDEGPPYVVSSLDVENDSPLSQSEAEAFVPLRVGEPASPLALRAGLTDLLADLAERGYLHAEAEFAITAAAAGRAAVRIAVRAGERLVAGDIAFTGVPPADEQPLRARLDSRAGKPLRERTLAGDLLRVMDFYRKRGYPKATARPEDFALAERYGELDFTIAVDAGNKVTVSAVEIVGNRRTRDDIIRRELRIAPGDDYDVEKLRASARRVYNLEYFEDLPDIKLADAEAGVLRVAVKERRTYRVTGALGYEPAAGEETAALIGKMDVRLANIAGTGREATANYQRLAETSLDAGAEYYEPWIGGVDLFARPEGSYRERVRYRKAATELSLGTHPALDLTVAAGGGFDRVWEENASRKIKVFAWAEYDSRDYFDNPRRGWTARARAELGVKHYLADGFRERVPRLEADVWRFWPLARDQVLAARLRGEAFVARRSAVDEYFPLGGHADLRGFREEQFFTDRQTLGTVEYRYLTGRDSWVFLFADGAYRHLAAEAVFQEGAELGFGAGFRAKTPVGIYGVDYGLAAGAGPLDGKIHISIVEDF